jgi:hypothetical protein
VSVVLEAGPRYIASERTAPKTPLLTILLLLDEHVASLFRLEETIRQETSVETLLATFFQIGFLLRLFFDPEDGGDMFL